MKTAFSNSSILRWRVMSTPRLEEKEEEEKRTRSVFLAGRARDNQYDNKRVCASGQVEGITVPKGLARRSFSSTPNLSKFVLINHHLWAAGATML